MEQIGRIAGGLGSIVGEQKSKEDSKGNFAETLKAFTLHVDDQIKEADLKTQAFAVGKNHNLHEVMIASEKANISFRLLLQIRNKLIEAYQEINRMQF